MDGVASNTECPQTCGMAGRRELADARIGLEFSRRGS